MRSIPSAAAVATSSSSPGGRSPGLILLVAAFALVLISLQSLSEISEVLLQHVDDSLLEDGMLFTPVDDIDLAAQNESIAMLDHVNDYYDEENNNEKKKNKSVVTTDDDDGMAQEEEDWISDEIISSAVPKENNDIIVLNVGFYFYHDRFKLMGPNLTHDQLDEILNDAKRTWLAANIVLNFTKRDKPLIVDDARADAYRWFVLAAKQQKQSKFWKDVNLLLKKGASKMTTIEAGKVIEKYYQFSGHALMDWMTPVPNNNEGHAFDVVTVQYWPWNNGGQLGKKIYFRSGTCAGSGALPVTRALKRKEFLLPCNGWNKNTQTQGSISVTEASRVLSHLIGHFLGLKHPLPSKCALLNGDSQLMCAPRKGRVESKDFFNSRKLETNEITQARLTARKLTTIVHAL